MKITIHTILTLLIFMLGACSDEVTQVDYTDDTLFPPPTIFLNSNAEINKAEYKKTEVVTGSINSKNGLRDIYITLLKNSDEGEYEEVNKNYRLYKLLDGFPNEESFNFEIVIADPETKAIGVYATDIYTKTTIFEIKISSLKGVPPVISLNPTSIDEVELNGNVSISGTAFSNEGLQSIEYVLARKSPFIELSQIEHIQLTKGENSKDFNFDIEVNDERADAVAVIVTDVDGVSETMFVDIKTITGIPPGRALIFDNIEMAAEWENPSVPTQPYIFSIEGLMVNGQLKNVVTLNDVVNASSGSVDFGFVNFWRNSDRVVIANRGLGFASADRITAGTVGRQVDTPWLSAVPKKATFFKIIPEEMIESLDLDNFFETTIGNWQTFEQLNQLSNFVTGTGTGDKQLLQRTGASSDRADTPNLQIVDDTYIAIRVEAAGAKKYGIIKVVKAVDDSSALNADKKILGITSEPGKSQYYSGPNQEGFEYAGVTKLYAQKIQLKIIIQQ